MARVTRNHLLQGLSGKLGNVVFRQLNGETIVQAAPVPKGKANRSDRQQEHSLRFAAAICYGRAQKQNPQRAALYATGIGPGRASVYHVALRDYMNAPQITAVEWPGRAGEPLRIWATDDFAVAAVTVRLTGAGGELMEEGEATAQSGSLCWLYQCRQPEALLPGTSAHVRALDYAGNEAVATSRR